MIDTDQCSWPSPTSRNWPESRQEIQARLYWGPCCSRGEQEQTTDSLACLLPDGGKACSLYGVRVGVCPGVGPEGWLRCFAHPLGGVVCRGYVQCPVFAPDTLFLLLTPCFCSRLFRNGSWFFLSFCIFWVQNLPQLHMHTVIFSPI